MVSKSIRSALVVALTLLLATLIGLPKIYAQSGDDVIQIELVGEIEALSTTTLTINGQVVDISAAELNTTLAVGEVIKIEGTLEADGSIVALEVNPVEEGELLPGEVEIIGPVEAFDTDSLTIGGLVIDISAAELEDALVLEVGSVVKVHMSLVTDASGVESWVAREVQDGTDDSQDDGSDDSNDDTSNESHPGEFEIVGTLTSIDGDTIVVAGLTIDIVSAEIKGMLVEGALVKVHLSLVDGVLVAREVELHDSRPSDDDESEDDNSDDNSNSNANNSNDDDDSNANNSNSNENEDGNENESNSNANNSNDDDDGSNQNTANSNENNNGGDDDQNQNDDNSGDSNNNDDHGSSDDDNGGDD